MYNIETARILWVISLFIPGLHRFYLGKIGSGLLYFFTGGLGMVGTIIDYFRLPHMVAEANRAIEYKSVLSQAIGQAVPTDKKESIERVILKAAKKNHGIVTASDVALEGDISLDQAREYLEKLAKKGFAEMRVKTNGVIVFCFADFMEETKKSEFESF